MLGTKASYDEIQARWGYSELRSDRWKHRCANLVPQLRDRAFAGVPFDQLNTEQREEARHYLYACRPKFADVAKCHSEYECQAWSKEDVCRLRLPKAMNPREVSLVEYANSPAADNPEDARSAASLRLGSAFVPDPEAIIVCRPSEVSYLVDGYTRAILFIRFAEPDRMILAWAPPID